MEKHLLPILLGVLISVLGFFGVRLIDRIEHNTAVNMTTSSAVINVSAQMENIKTNQTDLKDLTKENHKTTELLASAIQKETIERIKLQHQIVNLSSKSFSYWQQTNQIANETNQAINFMNRSNDNE